MKTIADLKGKKVGMGYSAMRTIDPMVKAILATGGLTEKDVVPVLIPNVIRGADDFASGAADMFFFAFGAPKVREVDATVGGIRALEISGKRHASGQEDSARRLPDARSVPNPFFIGVDNPMGVYTWDNMIFTNAKVTDDAVYKLIDTLEKNKAGSGRPSSRRCASFSAAGLYKKLRHPLSPRRLEVLQGTQHPGQERFS